MAIKRVATIKRGKKAAVRKLTKARKATKVSRGRATYDKSALAEIGSLLRMVVKKCIPPRLTPKALNRLEEGCKDKGYRLVIE